MARVLIGYKEMKNKKGKVLYFGEKNPWTVGVCVNDDKKYALGFVFDEDADKITPDMVGKEISLRSSVEVK